jgi:hypothetical protein
VSVASVACRGASKPESESPPTTGSGVVDLSGLPDGGAAGGEAGGGGDQAGGDQAGGDKAGGDKAGENAAGENAEGKGSDKTDGGKGDPNAASSGAADGGASGGSPDGGTNGGTKEANTDAGTGPNAAKSADPNPSAPGAPAGNVEFLAVSGGMGLSGDDLLALLEKNKQRYRGCYGKALASDPAAAGTIKLRASVAADGKVESVSVIGGNVSPGPLVQCTVATTKSLKTTATMSAKVGFDVRFFK